eukprot:578328-Amphidinium_carterae.1
MLRVARAVKLWLAFTAVKGIVLVGGIFLFRPQAPSIAVPQFGIGKKGARQNTDRETKRHRDTETQRRRDTETRARAHATNKQMHHQIDDQEDFPDRVGRNAFEGKRTIHDDRMDLALLFLALVPYIGAQITQSGILSVKTSLIPFFKETLDSAPENHYMHLYLDSSSLQLLSEM